MKTVRAFRITEDALHIMDALGEKWGLSRAGVLEMLLRRENEKVFGTTVLPRAARRGKGRAGDGAS